MLQLTSIRPYRCFLVPRLPISCVIFFLMQDDCAKAIADFEQALRLDAPVTSRYQPLTSLLNTDGLPIEQAKRYESRPAHL